MKAAFLYGPRDVRIDEIRPGEPGPGELLLDVTAVGVCGSDLHTFLSGHIGDTVATSPLILGHEAAGRVAALGPGLEGKFYVGQNVAIDPAIPCGECEWCEKGQQNLCARLAFLGLYPQHGALREQMVHPAKSCIPLPDNMTPITGALLEPLGVALHAIRLSKITLGDDVMVIGCGAIGLLLIRLAKLNGARRIFASDRHDWRLEMATMYGADVVIDRDEEDVVARVTKATDGRGVDVSIESAWVTDTLNQCIDVARFGGRVIVVGIPAEDFMTMRASGARRKGLTIKMSRRMVHTYPDSIALATRGQVMLDSLATHKFSLDQAQQALQTAADYADGVVRAMILPNR